MGRSSDARKRLIEAAIELLGEESYGGVGVEAICRKADVHKGSFYHFFPSKSALVGEALERYWQSYEESVLKPAFQPGLPPVERLARFLTMNYEWHKEAQRLTQHFSGLLFCNLAGELGTKDDTIRRKIEEISTRFKGYLESVLLEAKLAGLIEVEQMSTTTEAMLAYLEGSLLQARMSNDPEKLKQLGPYMLRLVGIQDALRELSAKPWIPMSSVAKFSAGTLDFVD